MDLWIALTVPCRIAVGEPCVAHIVRRSPARPDVEDPSARRLGPVLLVEETETLLLAPFLTQIFYTDRLAHLLGLSFDVLHQACTILFLRHGVGHSCYGELRPSAPFPIQLRLNAHAILPSSSVIGACSATTVSLRPQWHALCPEA